LFIYRWECEIKHISKNLENKKAILSLHGFNPTTAVIVGSGLCEISKQFKIRKTIKYLNIPYFLKTALQGHDGDLLLCSYGSADILILMDVSTIMRGIIIRKLSIL
jgi:purine nucleoside phosphorylase